MTHQSVATIGQLQMLHTEKKNFGFQLDRARKKLPGSSLKNIRQWIVDLTGLTKANNVDNLVHGVSLSLRGSGRLDTRLDTPHSSNRHHPVSALAQPGPFEQLAGGFHLGSGDGHSKCLYATRGE